MIIIGNSLFFRNIIETEVLDASWNVCRNHWGGYIEGHFLLFCIFASYLRFKGYAAYNLFLKLQYLVTNVTYSAVSFVFKEETDDDKHSELLRYISIHISKFFFCPS
jgi:hypothetical protein